MIINVLGLGESLKDFKQDGSITIGVNDIWKYHKTHYIVCVDRINAFSVERFKTIHHSKPIKFLSHLEEWQPLMPTFELIKLNSGRGNIKEIESENYCYSNNSPYVAVVLAYKLGATTINIYGVDFNTHKNFKDNMLLAAIKDFKVLFDYLKSKGIKINVTKSSKLNFYSNKINVV